MINRGFDFTNEDYLDEPNDIFKVFSKSINRKKIKFPNCSESIKFEINLLKNLESLDYRIKNNISEN